MAGPTYTDSGVDWGDTTGGGNSPVPVIIQPGVTGDERPVSEIENQDWRNDFKTELASNLGKFATDIGQPSFLFKNWIKEHFDEGLSYLYAQNFIATEAQVQASLDKLRGDPNFPQEDLEGISLDQIKQRATVGGKLNPFSIDGAAQIFEMLSMWTDTQIPGFGQWRTNSAAPTGTGSRGSSGPSAQDIRNSMDEEQMTKGVTDMWRSYNLEEPPDARRIAKDYIDEIVRTGGKVEMDFQTFVLGRIKQTSRYGSLYQAKPDGVDELQFMAPYTQTAAAALGGQSNVSEVAAQGAKLGADPQGFASRLQREDAVRNGTGFITGLEQKVRGVKDVLRG